MKFIDMKVTGVIVDPSTFVPMIILKDFEGKKILPLWVGVLEAASILMSLEGIKPERPITHDMTKSIITSLGSKIRDVAITRVEDNVFYASIFLASYSGAVIEIDSRPSDAIAVAMRCNVPVKVKESVIEMSKVIDFASGNAPCTNKDELTDILENLSMEDFGKYKM